MLFYFPRAHFGEGFKTSSLLFHDIWEMEVRSDELTGKKEHSHSGPGCRVRLINILINTKYC